MTERSANYSALPSAIHSSFLSPTLLTSPSCLPNPYPSHHPTLVTKRTLFSFLSLVPTLSRIPFLRDFAWKTLHDLTLVTTGSLTLSKGNRSFDLLLFAVHAKSMINVIITCAHICVRACMRVDETGSFFLLSHDIPINYTLGY